MGVVQIIDKLLQVIDLKIHLQVMLLYKAVAGVYSSVRFSIAMPFIINTYHSDGTIPYTLQNILIIPNIRKVE